MKTIRSGIIVGCLIVIFCFSSFDCASRVIYVRKAPPPVRVEVRSARPFPNAVWITGHWRWNGRKYVWVSGHWVKPRKGKVWVPGHWKQTHRGWRYVPGHWR